MSQGTLLEMKTEEIFSIFEPVEGLNTVYYGKVRNGKTYAATADILELLERGEIVYANWNIDFEGLDERKSFARVLMKFLFGKPIFYNFKKENFHYIDLTVFNKPEFLGELNRLVGVHLFIDEGQWVLPSLDKNFSPELVEKMKLVLHGGHYCRSLNIITQRPVNISKTTRSQINTWFLCEKLMSWPFLLFRKSSISDMVDDLPDETSVDSVKLYWPWNNRRVFGAYNTHGMRGKDAIESVVDFEVYVSSFWERLGLLWSLLRPWGRRRLTPTSPPADEQEPDALLT